MQRVSPSSKAIGAVISLLLVSACSGAPLHSPGQTTTQSVLRSTGRSPRLYVANFGLHDVTVYNVDQQNPSPVDTLTDGVVAPIALWIDAAGTLYVVNDWGENNPYSDTVTEFAQGSRTPTKVLTGLNFPGAIAIDSKGNVFVQDSNLEVFEHGSTTPTRSITGVGDYASALAVDDRDNVYSLVTTFQGPNEQCYSYVAKIKPGTAGGTRIGVSVNGCGDGLALDASENLYVAYFGNNNVSHIDVYRPGAHTPFRSIGNGVNAPQKLAFGPHGTLYVPNDNSTNVTVYPPGSNTPSNTIVSGIYTPFAVAISPAAPY
jgi:hypothetical protein